jgi:methionyl-tRNA formyltransferase
MEPAKNNDLKIAPLQFPRIVFMGTPEFAVASLEALADAGFPIAGVITAPDKPAGRGMKLTPSAVKKYALEKGFPVLQPPKLKDPVFLDALKMLAADLQVVVAFRMLPELVWNMPPLGTVNLHGSLLPQYRGAAPIQWAVINGEKETGLTTFKMQQEIDTGNILLTEKIPIGPDETAGELHDRMKITGAALLVKTIHGLVSGNLTGSPQAGAGGSVTLKAAPKLTIENTAINWNRPAADLYNFIRGLSPFPGAHTRLHDKTLKIYRSHAEQKQSSPDPGEPNTDGKTFLRFATADGYIYADELQLEGKKRLPVADFLRGYRPS